MTASPVVHRSKPARHRPLRSFRQKKPLSPWFVPAVLLAGVAGLATAMVVVFQPKLKMPVLEHVVCTLEGSGAVCPAEISQHLQPLLGQPLLFSPLDSTTAQLLQPVGYRLTSYVRILPSTLQVTITPLRLSFALEQAGVRRAVTEDGVVVQVPANLTADLLTIRTTPQVVASEAATTPQWLSTTVSELKHFFNQTTATPSALDLQTPFALEMTLEQFPHRILINPQESALNLARLSTILKSDQLQPIASPGATLDVRFRLPVLRR